MAGVCVGKRILVRRIEHVVFVRIPIGVRIHDMLGVQWSVRLPSPFGIS